MGHIFCAPVVVPFFVHILKKRKERDMYLMIDNYDSFVYNLKAYFEELGKEIAVIRCDKITLEEIEDM